MPEDVLEGGFGCNLAGYLTKVGEAEAEILGQEVGGKAGSQTIKETGERGMRTGEGLVMP